MRFFTKSFRHQVQPCQSLGNSSTNQWICFPDPLHFVENTRSNLTKPFKNQSTDAKNAKNAKNTKNAKNAKNANSSKLGLDFGGVKFGLSFDEFAFFAFLHGLECFILSKCIHQA